MHRTSNFDGPFNKKEGLNPCKVYTDAS